MENYDEMKCDVLIIGAGAAGLRTAIELHDRKVNVVIVSKAKKGDPHTVLATGGINAAFGNMDPEDNWHYHAYDTVKEGAYISNPKAVELLCKNAPQAVNELVKWGARFEKDKKGKVVQRFFGAQLYRRACFYRDYTGKEIVRVLSEQAKKRKIPYYPNVLVASLLKNDDAVNGALGIDQSKGKFIVIHSKCTVLAAGGYSRLYKRSSSRAYENFGDGVKLAYDVGTELQDMEMTQFHPTGMIWPPEAEGILVTEAVRGEGGKLFNVYNERFMKNYDQKRMELSARDIVARANYTEIVEGRGTEHGGVWLDVSHLTKKNILKRLPRVYKQFKEYAKIDITKERMEVAPTSHYSMGGVRVDHETGKTNIKSLFCIGENTAGLHGANRLGGNSLAETVVFGRLNGKYIAQYIKKLSWKKLNEGQIKKEIKNVKDLFSAKGHMDPHELKREVQEIIWEHVGIMRVEEGLKTALKEILDIKSHVEGGMLRVEGKMKGNQALIDALDVKAMVVVAEAVIRSALMRKESRGAHYRKDYLDRDDKKWKTNIIVQKNRNAMKLFTRKVPRVKGELKSILSKKIEPKYYHLE